MVSAGEASGDIHAAHALQQLQSLSPSPVEAFGMGGNRLAACGMELLVNSESHSVMGLVEVLHKYPQLRANLTSLRRTLLDRKPDILLLVDYPHFNMKLAATAKAHGIPVVFYIAPKVWASRPGRITELKKLVDHMAVILPFEGPLFRNASIPTTYVGNPLLDNRALVEAAVDEGHTGETATLVPRVALLPGSRKSEINNLLPSMLDAALRLKGKHPSAEFLIPVAETIDRTHIEKLINNKALPVELIGASDYAVLAQSDVALVASGTATLELAILGIPMVVVYRINPLSYAIVKRWLTIKNVSLVNIIADKKAVPELLQENATAENMFAEIDNLLTNTDAFEKQKAELKAIHNKLGSEGAARRLSTLLLSLISEYKKSRCMDNTADVACT